jgi:hypothetical protein
MIKFSDLDQRQVQEISEAFAKREGVWRDDIPVMKFYAGSPPKQIGVRSTRPNDLPCYHRCKNAMGRIIEGMDDDEVIKYIRTLYEVVSGLWIACSVLDIRAVLPDMFKATAHQQFVAAAMALNLVKEGK